jgi:hypothetical protein
VADKTFADTGGSAQLGVNLIERTVLRMGHRWRPIDLHDVGIDGEIELKDQRTGAALHRLVRVQVKERQTLVRETAEGFEFGCEEKDVRYWLRSPVPVVLVVVHGPTETAYYKCVTEWFADAGRQIARRVRFSKATDMFDENVGARLVRLTGGPQSAAVPPPIFQPEELVVSMLPLVQYPEVLWSAPSDCRTPDQAHWRFQEREAGRASDYILRDGRVFAMRDPRSSPLAALCDGDAEPFPTARWALSEDPNLTYRFGELLRRTLLQHVKRDLCWQPKRRCFYFKAPGDLAGNRFIAGARKQPRQVVWVERFTDDDGVERISYIRHHAFYPRFFRLGDAWYLGVRPTYYYSFDGEHESRRADVLAAGLKRREKNGAVLGSFRMWERWLTKPPSLLGEEPPLLVFGPAETVHVDRTLDEKRWDGALEPVGDDQLPGQQRFAA